MTLLIQRYTKLLDSLEDFETCYLKLADVRVVWEINWRFVWSLSNQLIESWRQKNLGTFQDFGSKTAAEIRIKMYQNARQGLVAVMLVEIGEYFE